MAIVLTQKEYTFYRKVKINLSFWQASYRKYFSSLLHLLFKKSSILYAIKSFNNLDFCCVASPDDNIVLSFFFISCYQK